MPNLSSYRISFINKKTQLPNAFSCVPVFFDMAYLDATIRSISDYTYHRIGIKSYPTSFEALTNLPTKQVLLVVSIAMDMIKFKRTTKQENEEVLNFLANIIIRSGKHKTTTFEVMKEW